MNFQTEICTFKTADNERLHVQRLMKSQNPKIGEVKINDLNDDRIVRKLDDSGFIDKAYAAQGMSSKP